MPKFNLIGSEENNTVLSPATSVDYVKSGERYNFLGKDHSQRKDKRILAWKVALIYSVVFGTLGRVSFMLLLLREIFVSIP